MDPRAYVVVYAPRQPQYTHMRTAAETIVGIDSRDVKHLIT